MSYCNFLAIHEEGETFQDDSQIVDDIVFVADW